MYAGVRGDCARPRRQRIIAVPGVTAPKKLRWNNVNDETRNDSAQGRFQSAGRKLDETFDDVGRKVERELKDVITYLNDQVVPKVRTQSSQAIRLASEKLNRLADLMDEQKRGS